MYGDDDDGEGEKEKKTIVVYGAIPIIKRREYKYKDILYKFHH